MSEDNTDHAPKSASDEKDHKIVKPVDQWITSRTWGTGAILTYLLLFFAELSNHWSALWAKCITLVSFTLTCGFVFELLVHKLRVSRSKAIAVSLVFGVVAGFCIIRIYPTEDRVTFSAKYSWTIDEGPGPYIWMVKDGVRTPIYCAMIAVLTNTGQKSFMVDSFMVSERDTGKEFKNISPEFGSAGAVFYFGPDSKAVKEIRFTTLETALQSKNLGSSESIRGYVFFIRHPMKELQLTLMNSLGEVSRAPFKALVTTEPGGSNPGFPMQPMLDDVIRDKTFDISTVPEVKTP